MQSINLAKFEVKPEVISVVVLITESFSPFRFK